MKLGRNQIDVLDLLLYMGQVGWMPGAGARILTESAIIRTCESLVKRGLASCVMERKHGSRVQHLKDPRFKITAAGREMLASLQSTKGA